MQRIVSRGAVAIIAILLSGLSGCAAPDASTEESVDTTPAPMASAPIPLETDVQFNVQTELDGGLAIAGTAWQPNNATTLVVFIHGFYGTRENYWHTLPDQGYSMALGVVADGRAALSLDMPGYGESGGTPELATYDVMADATNQIITQIKDNGLQGHHYDAYIGYGLSMGGFVVNIAQANHQSFNAIIPTSAPHTGAHSHSAICLYGGIGVHPDCPPTWEEFDFVLTNAEPDVINATLAGYEDINKHGRQANEFARWWGTCITGTCIHPTPYDEISQQIAVPVLAILGENDTAFRGDKWQDEPNYYPNSPDARSHGFPDVGHFIHNHKIQPELLGIIDKFLKDNGL